MAGQSASTNDPSATAARALVTMVFAEGSAVHPHVRALQTLDSAEPTRNAADALHHLSMLHGRYPGVVDHAAGRTVSDVARRAMFDLADAFATERQALSRLVVGAGPIPSTAGQSESEASVIAQRHAIDMLAQSDRQGCAAGAALATALEWLTIRRVLEAAGRRFGVDLPACRLVDAVAIQEIACAVGATPSHERAMLFGAQQIARQHHGLWDLLEARAKARVSD